MCQVREIRYTCKHLERFRLSACRGTYTKVKRQLTFNKKLSTAEVNKLFKESREALLEDKPRPKKEEKKKKPKPRDPSPERDPPVLKVVCTSGSTTIFKSDQECGPCQYDKFEKEWAIRLKDIEESSIDAQIVDNFTAMRVLGFIPAEHRFFLHVELTQYVLNKFRLWYQTQAWKIREKLTINKKMGLGQLSILERVTATSNLCNEVFPEDIIANDTTVPGWGNGTTDAEWEAAKAPFDPHPQSDSMQYMDDTYDDPGSDLDVEAATKHTLDMTDEEFAEAICIFPKKAVESELCRRFCGGYYYVTEEMPKAPEAEVSIVVLSGPIKIIVLSDGEL